MWYGNESVAFSYKSGGVGVYTGGSMNPKRAFPLIELPVVIDINGNLRNLIHRIRRYCTRVFMNSTVKELYEKAHTDSWTQFVASQLRTINLV